MIQWSSQFDLGHARIDAEHRIFHRLIEEFADRVGNGLPLPALARTLREIRQYAAFHFISEENIMEEMAYPGLAEHRAFHDELLAVLDERSREMSAGKVAPQALLDFVVDWFLKHTAEEDQKLVGHLRSMGWSQVDIINPFF